MINQIYKSTSETIIKWSGYVLISGIIMDIINDIIIKLEIFKDIISIENTEVLTGIYGSIARANLEKYEKIAKIIRETWLDNYTVIGKLNVIIWIIIILIVVFRIMDDMVEIKYRGKRLKKINESITEIRKKMKEKKADWKYIFPIIIRYPSGEYRGKQIYAKGEMNWKIGRKKEENLPNQEWQFILLYIMLMIIISIVCMVIISRSSSVLSLIELLKEDDMKSLVWSIMGIIVIGIYILLKEEEREKIKKGRIEEEDRQIRLRLILLGVEEGLSANIIDEEGEYILVIPEEQAAIPIGYQG